MLKRTLRQSVARVKGFWVGQSDRASICSASRSSRRESLGSCKNADPAPGATILFLRLLGIVSTELQ